MLNESEPLSHCPGPRLRAAYPQLFVTDMSRSAHFYVHQLGFTVAYLHGEPPFYGLVTRGQAGLNLRHTDGPVLAPAARDREVLLSANIPVDGVAELFAEFERRGVPFAQTLQAEPWGTTDFIVRDPDGNLICFASAVESRSAG